MKVQRVASKDGVVEEERRPNECRIIGGQDSRLKAMAPGLEHVDVGYESSERCESAVAGGAKSEKDQLRLRETRLGNRA